MRYVAAIVVAVAVAVAVVAAAPQAAPFKAGATVFVAPMDDEFGEYLKTAIKKKGVPVTLVDDKSRAAFEITGHSDTHKPGTAQKLLFGKFRTDEQASIQVVDLASGEVVFAYSVNKQNSAHGKQSTAESCAKHLKERVEKGK